MSPTHTLQPGPARQASGLRRWREGKVRPIPGSSPHDRPVSRGISSSLKESLRRSLPRHRIPHQSRIILGAQYAFSKAWRNLSGPMGLNFKNQIQNQIPGRDQTASRWRPEPRQKNAPGGTRLFSSSADEFRPAIPRSGCSPALPVSASPASPDYHAPSPRPSNTGHFYFAENRTFLLCVDKTFCMV